MDARVPIFAISSKSPSPRASEAIKSDMVKPMPQSQLAPKIWLQVTDVGRDPRPMRDARRANKVMPIGLPSSRLRIPAEADHDSCLIPIKVPGQSDQHSCVKPISDRGVQER
jgi:hypothetical protein